MNLTAKQQLSRNPSNAGYATPLKTYSVPATSNDDGTINVPAQPVYGIDPNVEPIDAYMAIRLYGSDSSGTISRASVINGASSGFLNYAHNALFVEGPQMVLNNAGSTLEQVRTPTIWRTLGLTTAAGATIVWPAVAGKKHRILGMTVDIAAGTTAAGACVLTIIDNATTIYTVTICGGALAASAGRNLINVTFPANGYFQIAANTDISVSLSSVLAAGGITANMWGTEE